MRRAEVTAGLTYVAGIDKRLRPFHDLRHTAITNDAAAGANPIAVMTKAGHSDMRTTKRYIHLAGVVFHDEAAALERRLLGLATPAATQDEAVRQQPAVAIRVDRHHASQ